MSFSVNRTKLEGSVLKTRKNIHIKPAFVAVLLLISLIAAGSIPVMAAAYITTATVEILNSAPVAENIQLETYRDVAVTSKFTSIDPEGDPVTYMLTEDPGKGTVTIDGDSFTYTPSSGKKGKDTFTYVAKDASGNVSNTATVTIKIKKQTTDITYSDMEDSDAWYEATALAENGIFIGEQVGGEYLFSPDTHITRGEFLVMCMELGGSELLSGITRTGFFDDEDIPVWQKPYVTTALMSDIISGRTDSMGRIVFSADDNITFAEATVMLNNTLEITDVSSTSLDSVPTWAQQASANLASCDIISENYENVSSSQLTRADAAKMLVRAMDLIDDRDDSNSLLSWVWG